jgi:hypothetical protein
VAFEGIKMAKIKKIALFVLFLWCVGIPSLIWMIVITAGFIAITANFSIYVGVVFALFAFPISFLLAIQYYEWIIEKFEHVDMGI